MKYKNNKKVIAGFFLTFVMLFVFVGLVSAIDTNYPAPEDYQYPIPMGEYYFTNWGFLGDVAYLDILHEGDTTTMDEGEVEGRTFLVDGDHNRPLISIYFEDDIVYKETYNEEHSDWGDYIKMTVGYWSGGTLQTRTVAINIREFPVPVQDISDKDVELGESEMIVDLRDHFTHRYATGHNDYDESFKIRIDEDKIVGQGESETITGNIVVSMDNDGQVTVDASDGANVDFDIEAVACNPNGCITFLNGIDFNVDIYVDYNPNVDTLSPQNVVETSAKLRGEVTDLDGLSSVDALFEWREVGGSWQSTSTQTISSEGEYDDTITGLDPDTDYEYRARINWNGLSNTGETASFSTLAEDINLPVVETNDATDITQTSAKLHGELTDMGDDTEVIVSFGYRKVGQSWLTLLDSQEDLTSTGTFDFYLEDLDPDSDYEFRAQAYSNEHEEQVIGVTKSFSTLEEDPVDWEETTKQFKDETGEFDDVISNLDSDTDYTYKACLEYNGQEICGDQEYFKTLALDDPTVVTNDATDIDYNEARLHGELTDIGGYDEVIVSFGYREPGEDWVTAIDSFEQMTSTGTFDHLLDGLSLTTEYEFKAQVSYNSEFGEGNVKTFTTTDPFVIPPEIVETIPDFNLGFNEEESFALGDYFDYYDEFEYEFDGNTITLPISLVENGIPSLSLEETGDHPFQVFNMQTHEEEGSYDITIIAKSNGQTVDQTFTVNIAEVPLDPPTIRRSIPDIDIGLEDQIEINLGDYFNNWQGFKVEIDGEEILSEEEMTLMQTDPIEPILTAKLNDVLDLESYNIEEEYKVKVSALNVDGETSQNFQLRIMEDPEHPFEPVEPVMEETWFARMVSWFVELFPDSEDLTLPQRLGFVLLTMIIASLLIFVVAWTQTQGIPLGVVFFAFMLNVFIFIFFLGLGYIPISALILIILILIGIAFLRFKGSGGE